MKPKLLTYTYLFLITLNKTSFAFNYAVYNSFINQINFNPNMHEDFDFNMKRILEIEPNYFKYTPFKGRNFWQCGDDFTHQNITSTSVHRLRPRDIKVVSAIGDSLTAALGSSANSIIGLLFENRGRSFSLGGDSHLENLVTFPNILKKFNPHLTGYSKSGFDIFFLTKQGKGLNVAVSGDEANNIPKQVEILVSRLRRAKDVDFYNDWKLVNIFIGGNDLCDFCTDRKKHTPEAYIGYLRDALDLLYRELPKTFVNLISVLNVADVKYLNRGLICTAIHSVVCPCAAFPKSLQEEIELQVIFNQYINFTDILVNSGRYEGREDFTVVVQPFFRNFRPPRLETGEIDLSYFAPDCFHLSTKGHAAAAIGLWNNMLEPVGRKSTTWNPGDTLKCPSASSPYLYTNLNSMSTYRQRYDHK